MNKELSAKTVKTDVPSMMEILIECKRRGLSPLQTDWFVDGAATARHKNHTQVSKRVAAWANQGRLWMLSEIASRGGE